MSKRTEYMNIACIMNKAVEEAEKINCKCNKYLSSKCNRCCLIDSLNEKMDEIISNANIEED